MRLSAISVFAPRDRRELRHGAGSAASRNRAATSRRNYIAGTARRQALRLGVISTLILGLAGGMFWANSTGRVDAAFDAIDSFGADTSRRAGFIVSDVLVEGRNRLGQTDILAALDIEQGMPIFTFSPEQARDRISQLGWVETASVARRLPNTIFVTITEREPLAVWQLEGRLALIDANGSVITQDGLNEYSDLIQVVGPDAEVHAGDLIAALHQHPEIEAEIAAAVWISDRRWNLVMRQGTVVRLPAGSIETALVHLVEMQRDYTVLGQEIVSIDLRLPDRLVVRLPSETTDTSPSDGDYNAAPATPPNTPPADGEDI